MGMEMKLVQVALSYGADDLHGTIIEEHIFNLAGATSPQLQTEAEMIKAIRDGRPHAGALLIRICFVAAFLLAKLLAVTVEE